MSELLNNLLERHRLTRLLPLYLAAYTVLLCGLGSYLSTYDDTAIGMRGVLMVLAGFVVSLVCRARQMRQNTMFGILAGMVVVLIFWVSVSGGAPPGQILAILSDGRNSGPGLMLAWFLILYSFAMIADEVIVFSVVPSIALLGLMASDNMNPEIVVYFLGLVVSAVFLLVYDNMLSRGFFGPTAHGPSEGPSGPAVAARRTGPAVARGLEPSGPALESQVRTSLMLTSVVAMLALAVGFVASLPLSFVGESLGRRAPQINLPAATEFAASVANRYINQLQLDGAPPRLSDRVVMEIRSPEPYYWRGRVFNRYTGYSWNAEETILPIERVTDESWPFRFGRDAGEGQRDRRSDRQDRVSGLGRLDREGRPDQPGAYGPPGRDGQPEGYGSSVAERPERYAGPGLAGQPGSAEALRPGRPGSPGELQPARSGEPDQARSDRFERTRFMRSYWRVRALDPNAWGESKARKRVRQRVRLYDPPIGGMLVSASEPAEVYTFGAVSQDTFRGIRVSGGHLARGYGMVSLVSTATPDQLRLAGEDYPVALRSAHTQLELDPEDRPAVRHQIAVEVTQAYDNPYDKVKALERYLQDNFLYSLTPPRTPASEDAVTYFLTQSKQGYCEIFASAMAVLCREVGIPARLATGFAPGEWRVEAEGADYGVSVVREKDLHAWTEVYFPGYGWITFDPTSSREAKSSFTATFREFMRNLFAQVTRQSAGPTLILLAITAMALFLVKTYGLDPLRSSTWWRALLARHHRSLSPGERWDLLYARSHRRLKRWAGPKRSHQTPFEYADLVHHSVNPEAAAAFETLTRTYVDRAFRREGPTPEDVVALLAVDEALKSALKRQARPQPEPVPA